MKSAKSTRRREIRWSFLFVMFLLEIGLANRVLQATSEGLSKHGVSWKTEYIYIVVVDETETKLKKLIEFADSASLKEFQLQEAKASAV